MNLNGPVIWIDFIDLSATKMKERKRARRDMKYF